MKETNRIRGEQTRRPVFLLVLLAVLIGLAFRESRWLVGSFGFKLAEGFQDLLEHFGEAVLIAGIVSGLLHLAEFKAFFKEFVTHVMVDKEFLRGLRPTALLDLRGRASEVLVEGAVSNPDYSSVDLHTYFEKLLFGCLPEKNDPCKGLYRRDYVEDVTVKYMPLREALEEIGEKPEDLTEEALRREIVRVESVLDFELVSPRKDSSVEETPFEARLDECSGIPPSKLIRLAQGDSHESLQSIELTLEISDGVVIARANPSVTLKEGTAKLCRRSVNYQGRDMVPNLLKIMSIVTQRAMVRLEVRSATAGEFRVEGIPIGGSPDDLGRKRVPDGLSMSNKGWLVRQGAFFFYWVKIVPPKAIAIQVAEREALDKASLVP